MINSNIVIILNIIWFIINFTSVVFYTYYSQLLFLIIGNIFYFSVINYYIFCFSKKSDFDRRFDFIIYFIFFYLLILCFYAVIADFNTSNYICYIQILSMMLPLIALIYEFVNISIRNKLNHAKSYIIENIDNNV